MARTTTQATTQKTVTSARLKTDIGGNGKNLTNANKKGWRQPTTDERNQMIQFAAYMKAEKRGFKNGDPMQDWVNAEKEVDTWLKTQQQANQN
jgi:hypothetical protein